MKSLLSKFKNLIPLMLIPLVISCEEKVKVRGVIDYEREVPKSFLSDGHTYKNFLIKLPNQKEPILISYKRTFWNKKKLAEFDSMYGIGDSVSLIYYAEKEFDNYKLILFDEK